MHAGFVRLRRIKSDCRSSEGSQCLGASRCVWRCLEALSLGLSLASGSHPSRDRSYMATGTEEGGSAILRRESSTPTTSATLLMVRLPSDATLAAIGHSLRILSRSKAGLGSTYKLASQPSRSPGCWRWRRSAAQSIFRAAQVRRGAGSIPAFFKVSRTVDAATFTPRPASSPWILRYPQ
jgi:hypothetical protein